MKKLFTFLGALAFITGAFSQAPEKMSYQAVIRNPNGELIKNSNIGMQISILQGSESGTPVYIETQKPTTNTNGLLTIEIGIGTPVTGSFARINWSTGIYYIKTETDPAGGTNYSITGTSQLLSVPYALFAKNAADIAYVTALEQQLRDLEEIIYTQLPLPTDGLVAYYPFNGNANDESGKGNSGTVNGATLTVDRFGKANNAYSFDGVNDYIQIPDNELFNSDNITVSIWVKTEKLNANTPEMFIINKRGNDFSDEQWRIYHQGTSPSVDSTSLICDAFSNTGNRFIVGRYVKTQVWQNLIMTINGSQIELFINGKLSKSTPISEETLRKTNSGVAIGARIINGILQSHFFGQIDDVRFYNRVLTKTEIRQLYNEDGYPNTIVNDIDGNSYNTVKIGTQVWMAENLKVTKYQNGDPIPDITIKNEWINLTSGAYCNYNNDVSYVTTFGRLYNFYAVDDSRKLCPVGWHIPTYVEWTVLEDFLGGQAVASSRLQNDINGFKALMAGCRSGDIFGDFGLLDIYGHWWLATQMIRRMQVGWPDVQGGEYISIKTFGASVRCLKD